MDKPESSVARQITRAAAAFVCQRTGSVPGSVDVTQSDETLVITLHNMFAQAGGGPTRPTDEVVKAHEFYRDLFAESSGWLRREISRITGLSVGAITGAVEVATGAVVVVLRVGGAPGAFGRLKELLAATSDQSLPAAGASAAPDRAAQLDALPPTPRCGGAPALDLPRTASQT